MAATTTVDVDAFWEDGYQVVRNVYSVQEIQELREDAYASKGRGGDLLSNPRLRRVLTDGRLVDIARQLLGQDEILYSGDSSFTINSNQNGFHKDNADRTDINAPDWQGRYTLLRFGIYLQDHSRHTGGLNLRAKSHNTTSLAEGKNVYVQTRVGDVGVWSLRTTHSGNGTLVRWPRQVHPEPKDVHNYAKWRIAKPDGDRIAVFAALGLDDHHTARYVEYLKTRTYMVGIWRKSEYDDEALNEADKIGLNVRDVPREIEGDDTVGQNEKWIALPY
jgi:hypothetical protein